MNVYLVTVFSDNYSFVTRYIVKADSEESAVVMCETVDNTPGSTFITSAELIKLDRPFWLDTQAR